MTRHLLGCACITGVLLALAGPSFSLGPLVFVAWLPLMGGLLRAWRQSSLTWSYAFLAGFCAGIPLYFSLTGWFLQHHIGIGLFLVLGLSIPLGLAAMGVRLGLCKRLRGSQLVLWITCVWTCMEILMGATAWLPACASGYALWHVPLLIQSADLAGVWGISLWIVAVNALGACLWIEGLRSCRMGLLGVSGLSLVILGYGIWRPIQLQATDSEKETMQVALIQSAVDTEGKTERASIDSALQVLVQQTQCIVEASPHTVDLVVWPETSVPVLLRSVDEQATLAMLVETARQTQVPMLVGALAQTEDMKVENAVVYNAAFLVPPDGFMAQEYHKRSLVPFYEVFLTPGHDRGLFRLANGETMGVVICWEALSDAEGAQLVKEGASFLVNITNDDAAFRSFSWAYRIPLPHAVFRAVETRRPFLRCANRGLSLAIDFLGRRGTTLVWSQETAALVSVVPHDGQTIFVRVGRIPRVLLVAATGLWGLMLLGRGRKDRIVRTAPTQTHA
ncbi:apolipoprotein N-acyltransferase [Planctomycetota bacterium]